MRNLIYYVASTLDGFIAQQDGSFDGFPWDDLFGADLFDSFPETFPAHLRPDHGARADNKCFDAVLMGRKTYEVGLAMGVTNPYPTLDQYVFSRTMQGSPDEHVELVREGAAEVVSTLKEQEGKAIWLCGGGSLAGELLAAGLIDRLVVKLNPVVFGRGIPLFSGGGRQAPLELVESKRYGSGHMLLQYRVRS